MKAAKYIVIAMALFLANTVQGQVAVSVNIGTPPPWGPVGYTEVRYYYLPDVEAYYDVQTSMFIYYGGGTWVHRRYLPSRYRNYDLYGGYKVVMSDYRGDAPYSNFREYRTRYARGYHGEVQRTNSERPARAASNARVSNQSRNSNRGEVHGNNKSNGQGNSHVASPNNGKNMKADHAHGENIKEDKGHGNGNGKKNK